MLGLDWSYLGVISVIVGFIRLVYSAAKAWAREPLLKAKISELNSIVLILNDDMERLESAHVRERDHWDRSNARFSGSQEIHETLPEIPTSNEPKP